LLAFGERSGYELARLAEDTVAYLWTPSRRHMYKVLPRLAASALARSREVEQRSRPDKVVYAITPAGRRALRAWLDEVEDDPAGGRSVFPLKLFFCEFASPGTARAHLDAYRRFVERRQLRYEQLREGPRELGVFAQHVLQHGLARTRATLEWIEETAAAIDHPQSSGIGLRSDEPPARR
jgi:DNA-binding PadR family transcriptional regulator